jgi:sterol desaturase/sphingolipid hydroxylase (fatty acid hydroxylase superfamily)
VPSAQRPQRYCEFSDSQLVVMPPVITAIFACSDVTLALPEWSTLIKDLAISTCLYDLWFWAFHCLMHTVPMYGKYHKVHHEWKAPCALEAAHFHLVDFVLGNYGPLILLPLLASRNYFCIFIFACLGVTTAAVAHSGYCLFPQTSYLGFFFSAYRHDMHHEHRNVNFSTFGVFDYFTGTLRT